MLLKDFTAPECERLRELCNFTPEELAVFDLRVKEQSLVEIACALNLGERTVSRRIANIKKKILRVQ